MTSSSKLERDFQSSLIKELRETFKGCVVMKLDSSYVQGVPDLLVLYGDKWATLECKRSRTASHRPNQDYYVGRMDEMSFSRFIYPENKDEVLSELREVFDAKGESSGVSVQRSSRSGGKARVPKSKQA